MNRREFLRALAGTAAVASCPKILSAAETSGTLSETTTSLYLSKIKGPLAASDAVQLGPRKLPVSRLCIGTGTNGWGGASNQTRKMGIEGLGRVLQEAHDRGVRMWDAADMYGTHASIKEALKSVPRDQITILTKTRAKTLEEMRKDIDRFRKELGTDYIDILLLHCVTDPNWTTTYRGAMDAVLEAQEKGAVRMRGLSCHNIDALRAAAKEPWVEVDLARINPTGMQMDARPNVVLPVLREMKKNGKGVIGMKVFGGGKLRDRQDEMIAYQLTLDCVDCFTMAPESPEEMVDLVTRIDRLGKGA